MTMLFEEECQNKYECEMNFNISWLSTTCKNRVAYYAAGSSYDHYSLANNWTFYIRDGRRREPVFFGVAFCVAN
jgi:hypothetical protein